MASARSLVDPDMDRARRRGDFCITLEAPDSRDPGRSNSTRRGRRGFIVRRWRVGKIRRDAWSLLRPGTIEMSTECVITRRPH